MTDACVLGFERRALKLIKLQMEERGMKEEFMKLEVVIRGNYLVKKQWRSAWLIANIIIKKNRTFHLCDSSSEK